MWHLEYDNLVQDYVDLGCAFTSIGDAKCRCKHFEDTNDTSQNSGQWVKANILSKQPSKSLAITNILKLLGKDS